MRGPYKKDILLLILFFITSFCFQSSKVPIYKAIYTFMFKRKWHTNIFYTYVVYKYVDDIMFK